jgi:hypothetical protein
MVIVGLSNFSLSIKASLFKESINKNATPMPKRGILKEISKKFDFFLKIKIIGRSLYI